MIAENTKVYKTNYKYGLLTSVKGYIKASGDGWEFLQNYCSEKNTHTTHVLPEAMDPCSKGHTSCVGSFHSWESDREICGSGVI